MTTKGHELEGFAGFEPNSYFMCTETSPRCFVIQRVNAMPGASATEVAAETPLRDVTNGGEPVESSALNTTNATDQARVADTPGSDADSAPPPFLFPWWFTNECRTALMNVPTTSSHSRPDALPPTGHNSNNGSPNITTTTNNNENDSARSKTPEVLTMEQLRERLKRQLEYYFSRENLINDRYLRCQMDSDRYVPIKTVSTFPKIKQLTNDLPLIVDVLRESTQVQVDESGEKVRPVPSKRCTIILRDTDDEDEVRFMFENCEQKYQSIIYGLNNSWYVTFPDEEATKLAFLHLKNLGKTFNGKPVHARIKDGGPPEANSSRMTPVPTTQGHVMFVSSESHNRIMTTPTGHIVVHELPWEGNQGMSQSHRSRSNTFTAMGAPSAASEASGVNGELGIGETLRHLGYAPKAVFRPFTAPRSVYSNAHTLTPSPAVSPSIANAEDPPRCDSIAPAVGNALKYAAVDDGMVANSPDSARLSPYTSGTELANKLLPDTDMSPDNDSPLMVSPENETDETGAPPAYMHSFGRQRITDAPKINAKGRQSPLFYFNPALSGVVPPAPYFMALNNGLYAAGKVGSSTAASNPYYVDQFSAPIISDINPAFYVDYDPSLMIRTTDASPQLATATGSPRENGGDSQFNRNRFNHNRDGSHVLGRPSRGFARAPPMKSPRLSGEPAFHDAPFHDNCHSASRYRQQGGGGGGGRPWPHYQRGWKGDEGRPGGPPRGGQFGSNRGHHHQSNDFAPSSRFNSSPYGVGAVAARGNSTDAESAASVVRPRVLRHSSNSDHNNHHYNHQPADVTTHLSNQSQRPAQDNWRPGFPDHHINTRHSNQPVPNYFVGNKNGRGGGKALSSLLSSPSYPTRAHHHSSGEGSHSDGFVVRSNPSLPQQSLQQQHGNNIDVSQLRPLSESYAGAPGAAQRFHVKHPANGELRQARYNRYNARAEMANSTQSHGSGSDAAGEEVGERPHHHSHQLNRPRIERPMNLQRMSKPRHHGESEKSSDGGGMAGESVNNESTLAPEYNFVEVEFPSLLPDSDAGSHTTTQEQQPNSKDVEKACSEVTVDEHASAWRNNASSHKPQFSEIVSGAKPPPSLAEEETGRNSPPTAMKDDAEVDGDVGAEQNTDAVKSQASSIATKSYAQVALKGPKEEGPPC